MNKKGGLLDPFFIVLFIFIFGIATIVGLHIIDEFEDKMDFGTDDTKQQYPIDKAQETILNLDTLFVFILIGLIIASMIGAYMIPTNPILFWVSFILLIIFLMVTAILSNAFAEITETSRLSSTASNFTLINKVVDHLGLTLLMAFALIALALYAKWRSE